MPNLKPNIFRFSWGSKVLVMSVLLVSGFLLGSFDKENSGRYRYPVDIFRSLTGTFGEPRSNHFHSGLDIRIGGRIGTPIKAAREGYVYRINVSPFGFGKALYLRHPDGQYSVYAHLNAFIPEVDEYIHRQQVNLQQSEVQLFLRPEEIPVKQGQVIAYGGNSGSSQGPHLHFEIRDPQERIINPMAFYQDELLDNIAPFVQEIMLIPLSPESHVEGWYEAYRRKPVRQGNRYVMPGTVAVQGPVGIAYKAFDLLNGARFHCGINYVRLYFDNRLAYEMSLDRFAFSETRYLNHHIDYGTYQQERSRFEKAFVDEGNRFSAYKRTAKQGILNIQDDALHTVRLELEDYHGNQSTVFLNLRREVARPVVRPAITYSSKPHVHAEVYRKVLNISVDCPSEDMLNGLTITNAYGTDLLLKPAYARGDALQFLYPLDSLLFPVAVLDQQDSLRQRFNFQHIVTAHQASTYSGEGLELRFPSGSVYQDTYLEVWQQEPLPTSLGNLYHIGDPGIPLHKYITLTLEMPTEIPDSKAFIALRDDDGEWSYQGNRKVRGRKLSARVRDFGTYTLMVDSVAPRVYPLSFRNGQTRKNSPDELRLKIEDDLSGIASKSIQVLLDDNWVPVYYDYKYDLISYKLRKVLRAGSHTLQVSASDELGNEVERTFTFSIQ